MVRFLGFIISSIVLGTVLAFGLQYVIDVPARQSIFTPKVGAVGYVRTLNPLFLTPGSIEEALSDQLFRGLMMYDENERIVGDIAEAWEIQDDGKKYVVTLKDDMRWSDGQPITPTDVEFTFTIVQSPNYSGWAKGYFDGVELELQDESTVVFVLENAYSPFLDALRLPLLPGHIFSQNSIEEVSSQTFTQRGPYNGILHALSLTEVMQDEVTIQVISVKSPIDEVLTPDIHLYQNQTALEAGFIRGDVDEALFVSARNLDSLYGDPSLRVKTLPIVGQRMALLMNLENIAEVEVRKGISQAIDVTTLDGVVTVGPYPDKSPFYQSLDEVRLSYDTDAAKDRIGDRSFFLTTINTPYTIALAKNIKQQFAEIDVPIILRILSVDELYETVLPDKDFDLLLLPQSIGREPDLYSFWHSSQIDWPGLNLVGFQERRVDRALELGRSNPNFDERVEIYKEFQEYFLPEHAVMYLTHPEVSIVYRVGKGLFVEKETESVTYWELSEVLHSEIFNAL